MTEPSVLRSHFQSMLLDAYSYILFRFRRALFRRALKNIGR